MPEPTASAHSGARDDDAEPGVTASDAGIGARYGRTAARKKRDRWMLIGLGAFIVVVMACWTIWAGLDQVNGTGVNAEQDFSKPSQLTLQQHAVGVGFAPACDCWRVDLTATQPLYPRPVVPLFSLNVTVARFGSIGVSSPR